MTSSPWLRRLNDLKVALVRRIARLKPTLKGDSGLMSYKYTLCPEKKEPLPISLGVRLFSRTQCIFIRNMLRNYPCLGRQLKFIAFSYFLSCEHSCDVHFQL